MNHTARYRLIRTIVSAALALIMITSTGLENMLSLAETRIASTPIGPIVTPTPTQEAADPEEEAPLEEAPSDEAPPDEQPPEGLPSEEDPIAAFVHALPSEVPEGFTAAMTENGIMVYLYEENGEAKYAVYGAPEGGAISFYVSDAGGNPAFPFAALNLSEIWGQDIASGEERAFVYLMPQALPKGYVETWPESGAVVYVYGEGGDHCAVFGGLEGDEPAFYASDAEGNPVQPLTLVHMAVLPTEETAETLEISFTHLTPEALPEGFTASESEEGIAVYTYGEGEPQNFAIFGEPGDGHIAFYASDVDGIPIPPLAVVHEVVYDFEYITVGPEQIPEGWEAWKTEVVTNGEGAAASFLRLLMRGASAEDSSRQVFPFDRDGDGVNDSFVTPGIYAGKAGFYYCTEDGVVGTPPEFALGLATAYSLTPGIFRMTSSSGYLPGDTEYDMSDFASAKNFDVEYEPSTSTSGTVLVYKKLAYGIAWGMELSPESNTSIARVEHINADEIAVFLKDGLTGAFSVTLTLTQRALTQAECEKWMDTPLSMDTNVTAREYHLPSGSLADLPTAEMGASIQYFTSDIRPAMPGTGSMECLNSYETFTYTYSAMTDYYLGLYGVGYLDGLATNLHPHGYSGNLEKPGLRYAIPAAHYNGTPLTEILQIKLYAPSEKLELLGVTGFQVNAAYAPLSSTSYHKMWSNWFIAETGTDAGGTYYILKPPAGTRVFNNAQADSLAMSWNYGMRPYWKLKEGTGELEYSETAITPHQGPDTIMTYQVPTAGGPAAQFLTHQGPLIKAVPRKATGIVTAYNSQRQKTFVNDLVSVGADYSASGAGAANSSFTYVTNNWRTSGAVEYVPETPGQITQTYEFPFEIQPYEIKIMTKSAKGVMDIVNPGNDSELASITYDTEDGIPHTVPPMDIASINAYYDKTTSATAPLIQLAAAEGNRVTRVVVSWNKLRILHPVFRLTSYGYVAGLPIANTGVGTSQGTQTTAHTQFGFRVMETHENGDAIQTGETMQVKYTSASTEPGGSVGSEDWLWFTLVPQPCPTLRSERVTTSSSTTMADGVTEKAAGHFYLDVGSLGEKRNVLDDPQIDFEIFYNRGPISTAVGQIRTMSEVEGMAFLSGRMTVTPAVSGWEFVFSTNQRTNVTYPVGEVTADREIAIPLAAGEYFTALGLRKMGTFNTGHPSDFVDPADSLLAGDGETKIYLVKNVMIRLFKLHPVTGEELSTNYPSNVLSAYNSLGIQINGYAHWDTCTCLGGADHIRTGSHKGQKAIFSVANVYHHFPPGVGINFKRQLQVADYNSYLSPVTHVTEQNVYQGAPTRASAAFSIRAGLQGGFGDAYTNQYGTPIKTDSSVPLYPWNITEAVYLELDATEYFIPDIGNFRMYGAAVSSGLIGAEIIDVGGRTFLKLWRMPGYNRSLDAVPSPLFKRNYPALVPTEADVYNRNLAGTLQFSFHTMPGTPVGYYHPVKNVYWDFTELLDEYSAPEYKRDGVTSWLITGNDGDSAGIATSPVTNATKLFRYSLGEDSANPYRVQVIQAAYTGASLTSGKLGTQYDFDSRITEFRSAEREQLNALVSFTNGMQIDAYDMTGYVVIPRIGKDATGLNGAGETETQASQYSMYLRGAPSVALDTTGHGAGNVSYAYTTDANPSDSSTYDYDPIANGWGAVTGVKIVIKTIPGGTAVNVRLDLSADEKKTLDTLAAYSSGTYSYRTDLVQPELKLLPLVQWRYLNYPVTAATQGVVYWDHDESGMKNESATLEPYASGITVTLYDTDGTTVIDTDTTDTNGRFALESYHNGAGQILEITLPSGAKLTKTLNTDPTDTELDSDVDRTTNRLMLPGFDTAGIANLSAGLVKLPVITIADKEFRLGVPASFSVDGLKIFYPDGLEAFDLSALPAAPDYRVIYGEPVNTGIVSFPETMDESNKTDGTAITPILVAAGVTTAKAWIVNTLGDVVEATYQITVLDAYIYNITYENLSGVSTENPEPMPLTYTVLELAKPVGTPSWKGFTFKGWTVDYLTDSLLDITVADPDYAAIPTGATGDVKLTAEWTVNEYEIHYDGLTGLPVDEPSPKPLTIKVTDTAKPVGNPTKAGYVFLGWTVSFDDMAHADVESPAKDYSIPAGVAGDVWLTAKWAREDDYIITYKGLEGTGVVAPSPQPLSYNVETSTEDRAVGEPSWKGYTFEGWTVDYTDKSGLDDITVADLTYKVIPDNATGNITLTAVWKAIEYNIEYTLNGGSNHASNPAKYTAPELALTISEPTRDHYIFTGWTVVYADGTDAVTTPAVAYDIPKGTTETVKLTAHWEPVSYPMEYFGLTGATADDPSPKPLTYTVESYPGIGAPKKTGYLFTGWTVVYADGTQSITTPSLSYKAIPSGVTGKVQLTANWQVVVYDIAYQGLTGAVEPSPKPTQYTIEQAQGGAVHAGNPSKPGYTFKGWTVDYENPDIPDLTTPTQGYTVPTNATGKITLTAQWSLLVYKVTYDVDGGVNATTNPKEYRITDSLPIVILAPAKTHYVFEGWTVDYQNPAMEDINSPTKSYSIPWGATGDIALTARWRLDIYNITYQGIAEANPFSPMPTTYNATMSFPISIANPTRNGYTFLGWTVDYASGKMADITSPKMNYAVPAGATGDIELTAMWKQNPVGYTPMVKKTVTGEDASFANFTFELKRDAGTYPMPSGANGQVETVSRQGPGEVTFGRLVFEKAGTYTYTLTEKDLKQKWMQYDSRAIALTIVVTDNGGVLELSATYDKNGRTVTDPSFNNTYDIRKGWLQITKTVTGTGGNTAQAFPFTVTLSPAWQGFSAMNGSGELIQVKSGDTFYLSHGQELTIFDIPEDTTYTVSERNSYGHTVSSTGAKGTVRRDATATAAFTNSKQGGTEGVNYTLTVNYWYDTVGGKQAAPTYGKTYAAGSAYGVQSPYLPGWEADQTMVSGKLTADTTVDVVYQKRTYTLTVHYMYTDGRMASPTRVLSDRSYGDPYELISPLVPGFYASMEKVSGTMPARDLEFTVLYSTRQRGDGLVNLLDDNVPLGLGTVVMNVGDCVE